MLAASGANLVSRLACHIFWGLVGFISLVIAADSDLQVYFPHSQPLQLFEDY